MWPGGCQPVPVPMVGTGLSPPSSATACGDTAGDGMLVPMATRGGRGGDGDAEEGECCGGGVGPTATRG